MQLEDIRQGRRGVVEARGFSDDARNLPKVGGAKKMKKFLETPSDVWYVLPEGPIFTAPLAGAMNFFRLPNSHSGN